MPRATPGLDQQPEEAERPFPFFGVYGLRLGVERDPSDHELLESELERHLAGAQDQQDRLADLLGSDPGAKPVGWPLRGEVISHLDRVRNELRAVRPEEPTAQALMAASDACG